MFYALSRNPGFEGNRRPWPRDPLVRLEGVDPRQEAEGLPGRRQREEQSHCQALHQVGVEAFFVLIVARKF